MKQLLIVLLLLSSTALGQKIQLPPTTRHTLENGLTVILMEYKKVPVVYFRMVVRGGSALDAAGLEGVASIAASLMREGTETRSSADIAKAIDFIGGSLSVSAGADYCAASAEVLKKDMATGLELFADVTLHPTFPPEEIERERKQRLANLEGLKEEPSSVAGITFNKNVYDGHPYGRQSFGTKASLEAITRGDLAAFYQTVFVPNNATLVVVGDFLSAEMLDMTKAAFGEWKTGDKLEVNIQQPAKLQGRKVILVNKSDATQTQMVFGNIGIDIKNPDYFPIQVANTIFGSGFTSRLIDELRVKRSLTYGARSGFPASLYGGTYSISTFTKNATVTEMVDAVLEEIGKYRAKGATADELKKGQNYIAGSFARSLQSPEALAARLTDIELYGFQKNHLETYMQKLRAVSLDDVKRVVQKYFLLDDLLIVLVTPAQETSPKVGKYGPVSVVELQDAIQ
ncbi:MAG: pitrilysin family protein [Bacteroidota bacterium]